MAGIISAVFTLAGIVFGGSGSVSVGDFNMTGFEIPEKMPFGGKQQTAVHKLLGGDRVIDLLGPDEADITWSGYFSGPQAASRASRVDQMRKEGAAVQLLWPNFGRVVVITEFRCSYERGGFLLPYSITCMVVPNAHATPQPSLLGQIGSDIADGLGITDAISSAQGALSPVLDAANTALRTVQAVLPVGAVLTSGSAAFIGLSGAVTGASGIINGGLALADGSMGGVLSLAAATGNVIGGKRGAEAVGALSAAAGAAQDLAGLTSLRGFVGRASANLGNASS